MYFRDGTAFTFDGAKRDAAELAALVQFALDYSQNRNGANRGSVAA